MSVTNIIVPWEAHEWGYMYSAWTLVGKLETPSDVMTYWFELPLQGGQFAIFSQTDASDCQAEYQTDRVWSGGRAAYARVTDDDGVVRWYMAPRGEWTDVAGIREVYPMKGQ